MALIDLDSPLSKEDTLDVVSGIVGKEDKSKEINKELQQGLKSGLSSFLERINGSNKRKVRAEQLSHVWS